MSAKLIWVFGHDWGQLPMGWDQSWRIGDHFKEPWDFRHNNFSMVGEDGIKIMDEDRDGNVDFRLVVIKGTIKTE